MAKRKIQKFSKKQVRELSRNKYVKRCGESSLTYTEEFKVEAMKQYEKGSTANEIFRNAGFDLKTIGKKRARDRIGDWREKLKEGGMKSLKEDGRSKVKRKRPKDKTQEDKIKRLEAEIAYLKEKEAFLARLRAREED